MLGTTATGVKLDGVIGSWSFLRGGRGVNGGESGGVFFCGCEYTSNTWWQISKTKHT